MTKIFCLSLILQSLSLTAFSATIEWAENTSQGSDSPKLTLSNWIENYEKYLPTDACNQSYFFGYVPIDSAWRLAHFQPFSIQAFRDKPNLKELSLSFKLWFNRNNVYDFKTQPIVTEKAKFSPKTLTGSAEYFKDYVFKSFNDFSYAFQNLKVKYFELYDGKLPANLTVLKEFSLNGMKCFQLQPLSFSNAEAKKVLSETKLKLYISLGNHGSEGLIYLTDWTISDQQNICPYDYFLLNAVNSRLLVAGKLDQLDQLRKVTQPMQGLIFNVASKGAPFPYIPNGRIRPGEWYFYNRKYDTLFQKDPRDVIPEVSVCDIAGNCFHYADPIDGKYVLDEQTKKFLGNTPFVRYSFNENKEHLQGHLSEQTEEQWKEFDEMKSQFVGSVKAAGTFIKDVHKKITIPMTKLDIRYINAIYALKCTKPIRIISVDFGRRKIDQSALPETVEPSFSTNEYFSANPIDVRDMEDVVLTLTTSADQAECQVDGNRTSFDFVTTDFHESANHDGSLEVENNIVRYTSHWVNYADNINFDYNEVKAEFEIESKHQMTEAMKQNVRVTRMIFGKDYYESYTGDYQNKWGPTIDFDKDGHKFKIIEDVKTLPQTPIGSAVKIDYIIQLPEYIPDAETKKGEEGTKNEYQCNATIQMKACKEIERKCLDNSFLQQNCRYETSRCLSSFNIEKQACTMVTQYIAHIEECEPTSCSNLLAKPIHKMNMVVESTPEVRRFYPLSSLAQNNETYLRVSFEPRPSYDSCVYFRYYGSKNKLLLKFDGSDAQLKLNNDKQKSRELEVEVCSSQYTQYADKVNGFTFMFTGSEQEFESNLNDHFVELVKFDFNKRLEE